MLSRSNDEQNNNRGEVMEYTLQGVIHFLQAEAHRYQRDRNNWEIEHAEMRAKIEKLEGEQKGLDKLKNQYLKRIEMLEDSLEKERSKLKELSPSVSSSITHSILNQLPSKTKSNESKKNPGEMIELDTFETSQDAFQKLNKRTKSFQFLEKCLQEITYLISSQPNISNDVPILYQPNFIQSQSHHIPLRNNNHTLTSMLSSINIESPSQSNENNLYTENMKISSNKSQELRNKPFNTYDKHNIDSYIEDNYRSNIHLQPTTLNKDENIYTEENKKNPYNHNNQILLSNPSSAYLNKATKVNQKNNQIYRKGIENQTINDKSELSFDSSSPQSDIVTNIKNCSWDFDDRNTFDEIFNENNQNKYNKWMEKFIFKNHLTNIRSVSMPKNENSGYASMATCGDDGLVKFWRLPINNKKTQSKDIVPQITYRGHSGIVTNVCIALEINKIFSAGIDSSIRCWKIPELQRNIYAPIDDYASPNILMGHSNAVWDLSFQAKSNLLASISADETIKLWDINYIDSSPLVSTLNFYENNLTKTSSVVPTSITFLNNDIRKIAVSWSNAIIKIYDIETGNCVIELRNDEIYDGTCNTQINKIVSHPQKNILISGHENKYIRFYDINSAQSTYLIPAHLDAVSSLDISPDGKVLVSGGHDASIRFWDVYSPQICIQEISNHHIKVQEGINDISWWHGNDGTNQLEYIASVGGDSVIKINAKNSEYIK
ncbi:hypothetical protein PCANB_001252 [Pneumocystis canis]|nr:hypothetical protein PCANB_001252 [Pneumocystis canis]